VQEVDVALGAGMHGGHRQRRAAAAGSAKHLIQPSSPST
jgi:hypothetical protein